MTRDNSNLPVEYSIVEKSLFDPILDEFDSDMSLYQQVMNKVDPEVFDKLNTKKKGSIAGLGFIDGGIYEEKLSLAGRTSSSDDVFTKTLSIAGSATFKGMLGVTEKASFAGKGRVLDNALFGGKVSIAGMVNFEKNVVVSGSLNVAGKANISEYLLADAPLSIAGNLSAEAIRCNNTLNMGGKVYINKDVIARTINLEGVSGVIEGNVYAEQINNNDLPSDKKSRDLSSIGGLFSYLKNTILGALKGTKNRDLLVQGNLIADKAELDNITINGDIFCKEAHIGENTLIHGTIYYQDKLSLPEDGEYRVEKGFPPSLEGNSNTT